MTLTPVARRSIDASETAEVWLVLVDLNHPAWPEDVHLVHNTEPVISNGDHLLALSAVDRLSRARHGGRDPVRGV